jgi:hypothetical protein
MEWSNVEVYHYTHVKRDKKMVRVKKKTVDVTYSTPTEVFVNDKLVYKSG